MALTVFGSISVLLLLSIVVARRKIHLFEGIILWSFIVSLQNCLIWMMSLNYKLFELSHNLANFWAFDCIRSVIAPVSIMIFIQQLTLVTNTWRKMLYGIKLILILVGSEYAAELLHVIHYSEQWKMWWSFAIWTSIVLFSCVIHKYVSSVARKDLIT